MGGLVIKSFTPLSGSSRSYRCLYTITPFVFTLMLAILAACVFWKPAEVTIRLMPENIHLLKGHAYAVVLPPASKWLPLTYLGDTYESTNSKLQLRENGKTFGLPHANLQDIQERGGGGYLHLNATELYFSTPDNSDPRISGRYYDAVLHPVPNIKWVWNIFPIGFGLLAFFFTSRVNAANWRNNIRVKHRSWLHITIFILISSAWLWCVWEPAPLIINSGDGGNVASIVAGWLERSRFTEDPVFYNSASSLFYMTLAVPATMFFNLFTHDIGQAYLLLIFPMLLIQMLGFYRLGIELFEDKHWSFLLALLSVPPVYIFSGELWGLLATPLTRGLYGAVFPYLLLQLIYWRGSLRNTLLLMAACGATIYLHPVSAPSVSLAIWIAMFAAKPQSLSWLKHLFYLILGGLVFVAMSLPFAIMFSGGYPSSANGQNNAVEIAGKLLSQLIGPQYYDVRVAILQVGHQLLIGGSRSSWVWILTLIVIVCGVIGFIKIPHIWPEKTEKAKRLQFFCWGLILASFGLCLIDQIMAGLVGRLPIQVDLIRNIRYLVPCALIFSVWFAVALCRQIQSTIDSSALIWALGVVCVVAWWVRFPTPLNHGLETMLNGNSAQAESRQENSRIIARISHLPPNSRILPLASTDSEGVGELVGLAIRYGAFQPVVYLSKDVNLLAYSGSDKIIDWLDSANRLKYLNNLDDDALTVALLQFCEIKHVDYVLTYAHGLPSAKVRAVAAAGQIIATEGSWQLIRINI